MSAVLVLILGMTPMRAGAARLNRTSLILLRGQTSVLRLKKYPKKKKRFVWRKTGKAVKIIRKKRSAVRIKAAKPGTSVVKIRSGKKTLKCKVTVIGKNAEVKLGKGSGSTLELGARVAEATSSNPKVVRAIKQGTSVKLKALRGGTAKIMIIVAGGRVVKLEITVPGKDDKNPAEKETETPDTEPAVEKPETPGTEPSVTEPETPDTEPETPSTGVAMITDRRTVRIGSLYHCNSDKHTYANYFPAFIAPSKSAAEAIAWIEDRKEEEKDFIEQKICESCYSDEYKEKLLNILHGKVELTDELKEALDSEFMEIFSSHFYSASGAGFDCTASSSNPTISFYGPWEMIEEDKYEEWKKLNKL